MKGPSPCSVVTKSACASAATKESWTPVEEAFVGMSSYSSADTLSGIADNISKATSMVTVFLCIARNAIL